MSYANALADLHLLVEYQYNLLDGSESGNVPDIFTNAEALLSGASAMDLQDTVNFESGVRAAGNALWTAGANAIRRAIVKIAKELNYPGNDVGGAFEYWTRYLTDTGEFGGGSVSSKFTARGITRGTLNSPANTKLVRIPYTQNNQVSQIGFAEAIVASVNSVSNANVYGVSLTGSDRGRDVFDLAGSATTMNLPLETELSSSAPNLTNPNLTQGSPATQSAPVTVLTGWELSNPAHWTVDLTKTFRSNAKSIETATNGAFIEQEIPAYQNLNIPYVPYAIVNPTAFTGTIDLTLGASSVTTISVGSNDTWNIITPTMDGRWFPQQFDTSAGKIKLKVNRTAGSLVVARVGILPLNIFGFGSFWGGVVNATNPVLNATATITDTLTVAGKYTHVFAALGLSLPVAGTNLIADPV